jgi:hypothetical protein
MTAARQCSTTISKYHANKELVLLRKTTLVASTILFVTSAIIITVIKEILKPDGTFASSEHNVAATFNSFFASVFTADDGTTPTVDKCVNPLHAKLEFMTFTPTVVNKVLKRLEPCTSAGPDGLPNVLLKNCTNSIGSSTMSHF